MAFKKIQLVYIVANNENQSLMIWNTLENDTRTKSLMKSSKTVNTVYMKIEHEDEINSLQTEFESKFQGCDLI